MFRLVRIITWDGDDMCLHMRAVVLLAYIAFSITCNMEITKSTP